MQKNFKNNHSKVCRENYRGHHENKRFSYFHPHPLPYNSNQFLPNYSSPAVISYTTPQYPHLPSMPQQQYSQGNSPYYPQQYVQGPQMIPSSQHGFEQPVINSTNYDQRPIRVNNNYNFVPQFDYPPYNSSQRVSSNSFDSIYEQKKQSRGDYFGDIDDYELINRYKYQNQPISVEDEYNWALHISNILDEFINRNRVKRNSHANGYVDLKETLNNSLRHLKEAEELNKSLLNLAKLETNEINSNYAKEALTKADKTVILNSALESNDSFDVSEETVADLNADLDEWFGFGTIDSSLEKDDEDILDFVEGESPFELFDSEIDNSFEQQPENDEISIDPFGYATSKNSEDSDAKFNEINNDANDFQDDVQDYVGANAPTANLNPENDEQSDVTETGSKFDDAFRTNNKPQTSRPVKTTYKNYTINTLIGKVKASEVYNRLMDEFGQIKVGQFEIMDEYGLTQKQYDKLIDNFYEPEGVKKQSKKAIKEQIGVVIQKKRWKNKKFLWILFGTVIFLVMILVVLYFTVPMFNNLINF